MVGIPECLETLLADLMVCSSIHEQHTQKHDVPGDASWLGVVDFNSRHLPNLTPLHIEKVDIMRTRMHNRPKQHRIRDLSMKPLTLIQRDPFYLRPNPAKKVAAHGEQYDGTVDGEAETCAAGDPDREGESVKTLEAQVLLLLYPPEDEEAQVPAVEEEVEEELGAPELVADGAPETSTWSAVGRHGCDCRGRVSFKGLRAQRAGMTGLSSLL